MYRKCILSFLSLFLIFSIFDSASASKKTTSTNIPYTDGRLVYLTFDDGPNRFTPKLLDVLKRHNVHATFFILGSKIDGNEAIIERIVAEGHTIGLHSMTHDKKKLYQSPKNVVNEMKQVQKKLKAITGETYMDLRVPYGSVPHMKKPHRDAIDRVGFRMWDWNVDSLDWKLVDEPNQMRYDTIQLVRKNRKQATASVVLMHDHATSPDSLSYIIRHLKQDHFLFRTVDTAKSPYHFFNKW